jgi:hypothetical protein
MGEKKNAQFFFWWGNLKEKDSLEDPGIDNIDINIYSTQIGWNGAEDWTYLAQCRDNWPAPVTDVMNLRVP